MKKVRNIFCLILAIIMLLLTACTATTGTPATSTEASVSTLPKLSPTSTTAEKVYLGIVIYLTGSGKALGEYTQQGIEMALKEINASGGILGHQVEAKYFDSVDTLETCVNAVKLALEDKTLSCIFINATTAKTLACTPYILEGKVPTVMAATGDSIKNEKNPYVWQLGPLTNYVGVAVANFVSDELKAKNPAIWHISSDDMVATKDVVVATLKGKGIEVPENMIFASAIEEKNMGPIAAGIKASGADSLMIISTYAPIALLAKALKDVGVNIPVVSLNVTNTVIENAGGAVENWYCAARYVPSENREAVKALVVPYQAKYGIAEPDVSVASGYDLCYLFKAACEAAGSTSDRELINEGFSKVKNLELTNGIYNSFDDHTFISAMFITQVKNGLQQYVSTVKYR